MFRYSSQGHRRGFTILELMVVITIIGLIATIGLLALGESRIKGRDGARKTQSQEIIKALEIYYSDNNGYPADGAPAVNAGELLDLIDVGFYNGQYINRPPEEDDSRYYYCTDSTRRSMLLAVDTEGDEGGSGWCAINRGPGPDYGCTAWQTANATDLCANRFR